MNQLMREMLFLLGLVIGAAIVLQLSACSVTVDVRTGAEPVDVFPALPPVPARCDLGVLRGSKDMRCSDELNRSPVWGWA